MVQETVAFSYLIAKKLATQYIGMIILRATKNNTFNNVGTGRVGSDSFLTNRENLRFRSDKKISVLQFFRSIYINTYTTFSFFLLLLVNRQSFLLPNNY